jgi:hypothetical protein
MLFNLATLLVLLLLLLLLLLVWRRSDVHFKLLLLQLPVLICTATANVAAAVEQL